MRLENDGEKSKLEFGTGSIRLGEDEVFSAEISLMSESPVMTRHRWRYCAIADRRFSATASAGTALAARLRLPAEPWKKTKKRDRHLGPSNEESRYQMLNFPLVIAAEVTCINNRSFRVTA